MGWHQIEMGLEFRILHELWDSNGEFFSHFEGDPCAKVVLTVLVERWVFNGQEQSYPSFPLRTSQSVH